MPDAHTPAAQEYDLEWLEHPTPPATPAGAQFHSPVGNDDPTMQIPILPEDAPTMRIPDLNQAKDEGPDLLYSGMPDPVPKPAPLPEKPSRRPAFHFTGKTGLILGIVSGCLVLAVILGVFFFGLSLKHGDTIYPNVYVAGINLGGMTRQEALDAAADVIAASYTSSTLKVELPDRTLNFSPSETNISLSADQAIDKAMAYGRSGNPFSAVTAWFSCRSHEQYLELQSLQDLDTDYIRSTIEAVAEEIETDPQETTVQYDAATETLQVDVGYPDRSLDTDGLVEVVCNALVNRDFHPISWDYDETPCAVPDLDAFAELYGTPAQDAQYDEEHKTIIESIPGYGFDLDAARKQIASAASGSHLTIALSELQPQITTEILEKDMFGTTLFETSSQYVVNANRTTNLTLACQAIDGTILNPGDVFSFNNVVGERTADKGYKAATVYSGGQSVDELGGGVCQVASTLYYATLHLDLEQVHREPHQFVVTYVPYGMDATVYWGQIDYQFKNTLSNPIRILANTDGGSVNITIQGIQETKNTVKMEYVILETYPWQEVEEVDDTKEPGFRQVEVTPYTGYKVVTYKTILDGDGNQISREQEAISTYSKRDQKVIVGPEETLPDPDPWDGWYDDTLPWPDDGDQGSDDELPTDPDPIPDPWG